MNKLITRIIVGLSLLIFGKVRAQQWELVTALPQTEFTVVKKAEGKIYAAAENKLYSSTNGINWQSENYHPIPVTPNCITVYNNVLYIGTISDGVYFRNLTSGANWQHALMGLHISTFIEHDGRLHLCSQGSGVWRNIDGTWNNMTFNLPTYSYTVNKIISLEGKLFAFAGANGTFYRFDPPSSKWIEDYYHVSYQPGLSVDDAVDHNGAILVSKGNRLLRSEDRGDNWVSDDNGLINGVNRFLYKGAQSIYSLTLDLSTNFTQFQRRNNTAASQSDWGNYNELLPFYSYGMEEFNDKIYIASNQGVYIKQMGTLGIENPAEQSGASIFPIPSADGCIQLIADTAIEQIEAYDINGRLILSQKANSNQEKVNLPGKGIYLIKMSTGGQIITKKAVVQ